MADDLVPGAFVNQHTHVWSYSLRVLSPCLAIPMGIVFLAGTIMFCTKLTHPAAWIGIPVSFVMGSSLVAMGIAVGRGVPCHVGDEILELARAPNGWWGLRPPHRIRYADITRWGIGEVPTKLLPGPVVLIRAMTESGTERTFRLPISRYEHPQMLFAQLLRRIDRPPETLELTWLADVRFCRVPEY